MTIPVFLDMSRETQHVILITVNMKNTISLFFGRLTDHWAELNTHVMPDKETYKDRLQHLCDPSHIYTDSLQM